MRRVALPRSSGTSATTIGVRRIDESATASAAADEAGARHDRADEHDHGRQRPDDDDHEDGERHWDAGFHGEAGEADMGGEEDQRRDRDAFAHAAPEPVGGAVGRDGGIRGKMCHASAPVA